MTNEIIARNLRGLLDRLSSEKNSAVVLKGVPLSFVGDGNFRADLDAAKDNPVKYFFALVNGGRNFFTHEEFLLLHALIFMQYDAVYVISNNVFMEQYPIEAAFGDATRKILLEHFTEPENEIDETAPENLGSVAKIVDMFVGLQACGDFLVGVYNDEQLLNEPKVKVVNLFAPADITPAEIDSDAAQVFFDVQDETDFVDFAREIFFCQARKNFCANSQLHRRQSKAQRAAENPVRQFRRADGQRLRLRAGDRAGGAASRPARRGGLSLRQARLQIHQATARLEHDKKLSATETVSRRLSATAAFAA